MECHKGFDHCSGNNVFQTIRIFWVVPHTPSAVGYDH